MLEPPRHWFRFVGGNEEDYRDPGGIRAVEAFREAFPELEFDEKEFFKVYHRMVDEAFSEMLKNYGKPGPDGICRFF
jgi:hypothetical protein